jgi:hypothetical protein
MKNLNPPINFELPFIAYGSFKPNELRFNLIKPFVSEYKPINVVGLMKEKDGVPIIYTINTKSYAWIDYSAFKIYFKKGKEQLAYKIISENEPNTYYNWVEYEGGNLLEGVKKLRGLEDFLDYSWSFKNDPYFSQGLLACKEISNNQPIQGSALDQEYFHFFSNQSAFMLLWTIIERFCSIKYGNLSPTEKLKKLSSDTDIDWSFAFDIVKRNDSIIRSDRANDKLKLDSSTSIKKILDYYYGLRSNVVHRGKNVFEDSDRIIGAFNELYQIVDGLIKPYLNNNK